MSPDERYVFIGLFMFVLFIVLPSVFAVVDLRVRKKRGD